MADTPASSGHEGGFKHFMTAQTGPLPNWVWGVVIVGTLGAVYVLPKFFGGTHATSANSNTPAPTSLAIDPTTGLPYATEGLIPAGGSITPGNTTPADMSALYQELSVQQQQTNTLLQMIQNWLASFSQPTPPTHQPGMLPSQAGTTGIAQPTPAELQQLHEQNPGTSTFGLMQQWFDQHRPTPHPITAMPAPVLSTAQQAIDQWEAHTHQIWTGPAGSFPAGWGPTPNAPGAGVIQQGVFHYVGQSTITGSIHQAVETHPAPVNAGNGPIYRGRGGFLH